MPSTLLEKALEQIVKAFHHNGFDAPHTPRSKRGRGAQGKKGKSLDEKLVPMPIFGGDGIVFPQNSSIQWHAGNIVGQPLQDLERRSLLPDVNWLNRAADRLLPQDPVGKQILVKIRQNPWAPCSTCGRLHQIAMDIRTERGLRDSMLLGKRADAQGLGDGGILIRVILRKSV